jgi:vacuolar-type H+-ATPase subunit E/Vma4
MAEAKQRSRLLAARQQYVDKLAADAKARLSTIAQTSAAAYNVLLKGLIKQAMQRLSGEQSVEVHARPQDVAVATKAAAVAASEVGAEAKAAGRALAVTASVVADPALAGSAGGVVVHALGGRIKCNNTLEARLGLVLTDLLPVIRDGLFPSARAAEVVKPPVHFAHAAAAHAAPPPPAAAAAAAAAAPPAAPRPPPPAAAAAPASPPAAEAAPASASGAADPFAF